MPVASHGWTSPAGLGVPLCRCTSRSVLAGAYTGAVATETEAGATSPLLEALNPVQREAVLHTDGPVLIVAGAGSGKTRALTHRIAFLIREQDVSPYSILAITFTNKAAREMVDRVESLLGTRVAKGMWILTFHSTCARILRREHTHLGVPSSFSIYDEGDTERVISMALKAMELSKERADAVRAALLKKHPEIDAKRIEIVGRGWEEPAGTDGNLNRRVEVQWFTLE